MSAESHVLNMFQQQNKPFSLQNLVDFLAHQGVKKAAITKALDSLVESGKIVAKVWCPNVEAHNNCQVQVVTDARAARFSSDASILSPHHENVQMYC